jgi:hypothetical protein
MREMILATDKPRFSVTLSHELNTWLELYCSQLGNSKSDVIERALRITSDMSEEKQQALINWANNEYRNPEVQIRLILEKAIDQWLIEQINLNRGK